MNDETLRELNTHPSITKREHASTDLLAEVGTSSSNLEKKYAHILSFNEKNQKKHVVVGMSGGVDSSLTALILKKRGYKVTGMFMKNWDEVDANGVCTAEEDFEDVKSTCAVIDIPCIAIDFTAEYKDQVFSHFLQEYKKGNTPNPDILCNKEIKFKVFYDKAMALGADYLATGHYCINEGGLLKKGIDQNKDQSYFLHAINPEVLKNVLFPLGELEKTEVRNLAEWFDLPTKKKKDSTGICFIGERDFREFLSQYISSQKGKFKTLDGETVGVHEGACFYTVGQRKHLGLGGQGPRWFVVDKCLKTNTVFVERGDHSKLYRDELFLQTIDWLVEPECFPMQIKAKIRYRQTDQPCRLDRIKDGTFKVSFDDAQKGAVLGQSVVFYDENLCLGGGVVTGLGEDYYSSGKPLPTKT